MSAAFEAWLRSTCFQKPTPEAYDLPKSAWEEAAKTGGDRYVRSDWERAHELLDKAGVLTTPADQVGRHLIERIEALLAVYEPIGRLSAQSCHDLKFLCNASEETIEAIRAHRASFRR